MYRTLYSPQGGRIILDGREVINMASNNYLGLANHPAVVAAAKEALEKYGVAPVIINDRTFVPVRFVADELGAETAWDEATKTVTITKVMDKTK